MRGTFITLGADVAPLQDVQAAVGHDSLDQTRSYVQDREDLERDPTLRI